MSCPGRGAADCSAAFPPAFDFLPQQQCRRCHQQQTARRVRQCTDAARLGQRVGNGCVRNLEDAIFAVRGNRRGVRGVRVVRHQLPSAAHRGLLFGVVAVDVATRVIRREIVPLVAPPDVLAAFRRGVFNHFAKLPAIQILRDDLPRFRVPAKGNGRDDLVAIRRCFRGGLLERQRDVREVRGIQRELIVQRRPDLAGADIGQGVGDGECLDVQVDFRPFVGAEAEWTSLPSASTSLT